MLKFSLTGRKHESGSNFLTLNIDGTDGAITQPSFAFPLSVRFKSVFIFATMNAPERFLAWRWEDDDEEMSVTKAK